MNRPARQRARLLEKIARKETRSTGKNGKRTKAWRKWAEHYKAIAEGTGTVVALVSGSAGSSGAAPAPAA
jgi:hypothetical protein